MKEYRQNSARNFKNVGGMQNSSRGKKMVAAAERLNNKFPKQQMISKQRSSTVSSGRSMKENANSNNQGRFHSQDNRNALNDISNIQKYPTQSEQNHSRGKYQPKTLYAGNQSRYKFKPMAQSTKSRVKLNISQEVSKQQQGIIGMAESSGQPSTKASSKTHQNTIVGASLNSSFNHLDQTIASRRTQRSNSRQKQMLNTEQSSGKRDYQSLKIENNGSSSFMMLNQSLADQKIDEQFNEESQVTVLKPFIVPQETDLQKIIRFNNMKEAFYDPVHHRTQAHLDDILPVDLQNIHNQQHVVEYANNFQKSMQREVWKSGNDGKIDEGNRFYNKYPSQNCIINQNEITQKMRRILIDWLVSVHVQHRLQAETLFICTNLIDRYCERKQILKKEYQLVGVTCMFIAAKYEEIYPPQISKFSEITDRAYTIQEIKTQEIDILAELSFDFTFPTSLRFLERYTMLQECDLQIFYLARYMLELSLIEVTMNRWCPSLVACSAIFVSKRMLGKPGQWNQFMIKQTGLSEQLVRLCAKDLCFIINIAHIKRYYKALLKKYSQPKFFEVALICRKISESSNTGYRPIDPPAMDNYMQEQARQNFGYHISPYVSQRPSMNMVAENHTNPFMPVGVGSYWDQMQMQIQPQVMYYQNQHHNQMNNNINHNKDEQD